jgi:hypothetical protein
MAQLETVRLNGFRTIDLMKSLPDNVHELSENVPTTATPHRNPTGIYASVAVSGSSHSPSKESAERGYTLGPPQLFLR